MCPRFAFLLITRVVSWLRLSQREDMWKTAEILILRHQLAVLRRRPRLNWAVAGHLQREPPYHLSDARPSRCAASVGPVAPDQLGVPAQERARVMIRDSLRRLAERAAG
jgi:hypothetical protein